jgi:hypothetical protein
MGGNDPKTSPKLHARHARQDFVLARMRLVSALPRFSLFRFSGT